MVFYFARGYVRLAESWYTSSVPPGGTDVIQYFSVIHSVEGSWSKEEFWTLWIDLAYSEDELFTRLHRTTKQEIKQAILYAFVCEHDYPASVEMAIAFSEFHDRLANARGLPLVNRRSLTSHARAGTLDLSRVISATGQTLAWHAYYRDGTHSQALWSASVFRQSWDTSFRRMVSRAHRFLHWQDILRHKAAGLTVYDFGGWYSGSTDRQLLRVNAFKESFGGTLRRTYRCVKPITFKGKLYLAAVRIYTGLSAIVLNPLGSEHRR